MAGDEFFEGLDETKAMLTPRDRPRGEAGENPWRVLAEISSLFNSPMYAFDEILGIILDATMRITGADRGFLMLFNDDDRLEVRLARNMIYAGLAEEERRVSQSVVEEVLRKEEGVFIANVEDSGKFSEYSSIVSLKILSVMCAPLKVTLRGEREGSGDQRSMSYLPTRKILGVIYVDGRSVSHSFNENALELLQALANNATTAILNSTLYRQATTDEPTGLFTRRHFERRLKDEIKLAQRHSSPLSLLMVDVDEMKAINDARGYSEGDRILARIAELCRSRTRAIDLAARYGGGKFTVILPQTDGQGMKEVGRKILRAVAETNFFPDEPIATRVTVSIGAASYEAGLDPEGFIKLADKALYQAKREGRNQVRVYTEDLEESAKRTDRLAGVLTGDPSRDYRNCLMLLETIEVINRRTNFDDLLPFVIDVIVDLAEAERGLLILARPDGELEVQVARDRAKSSIADLEFSRSVVERVLKLDQPVRETFTSDSGFVSHSIGKLEIQAVMCVPLTIQGQAGEQPRSLGAIYVDRRERGGEFDESSLAFFDTLARQISVAIENTRLYSRNEQLRKQLARQLDQTKEELHSVRIELADREKEIEHKYNYDNIVGRSPKMVQLFQLLDRITDTLVPVFIHGESGTGKELVAKAIHYNGPRRKKRMLSENCAAMSETLLESELFGSVKGAFTGAVSDRKGLFEIANGGTLFLDEVGDMSMSMQKKLLRVLQEEEVRRVGGKETIEIDVRIISASNKDLMQLVEAGQFRRDLYYRLNVVQVSLPPLRERLEDIPLLAEAFLNDDLENGQPRRVITSEALQMLMNYHWPGNVRELKNVFDRAKIVADGNTIDSRAIQLDAPYLPTNNAPAAPVMAPPTMARPAAPPAFGGGFGERPPVNPAYMHLNARQRKLIDYLTINPSIRNREYYELMGVSKSTGWRDLKMLIDEKLIRVHGKGKGSFYTLSERDGSPGMG